MPSRPKMNGVSGYIQQSVLTAVNRFVKTMNSMEGTALVPSRLRDRKVKYLSELTEEDKSSCVYPSPTRASSSGAELPSTHARTDLYSSHSMLNAIERSSPRPSLEEDNDATVMKDWKFRRNGNCIPPPSSQCPSNCDTG